MLPNMTYTAELGQRLRARLFECDRTGPRVLYNLKNPADLELARNTWVVHGVCLECRHWTITTSRCPECGIKYELGVLVETPGSIAETMAIQAAVSRACWTARDALR